MILNRIQVEGFKALRNRVELDGLGVGIHLIHGPNETGKSTLVSAVARGLFDRYNTTDQDIKALRPWGTELAPRVTLEFETGEKRYRLEKRFLDEESSSLSEWNGSRFERVADSVKADDKVRSFMLGTASRSGAAGLGNWGLARLLWMTQLPSRLAAPALDEPLRQHLLSALGSSVLSEKEQALIARLDKAYDVYYTAAKQSEKKGSPLQEARDRLARAEEALAACQAKWDEVSRLGETAAEAQARMGEILAERAELDARVASLAGRARQEQELEAQLKVKEQQLLVAQARWKSLHAAHAEIEALGQGIARHEQELAKLEPGIREAEASLESLAKDLASAEERLKVAAEAAKELARETSAAALLADSLTLLSRKRNLEELRKKVAELELQRAARAEEYAARRRPKDDRSVEEVRGLASERDALRSRLTDLGIQVAFTPERAGLELEWTSGGETSRSGGGLDETVFRSIDEGVLVIPGVGRLRVRSGAEDSLRLKERLAETEGRLQARLAYFGVASVEELQALRAATLEIETAGKAIKAALDAALGGVFASSGELKSEHDKLEAQLQARLAQLGTDEAELRAREAPEVAKLHARALPLRQGQEDASRDRDALAQRHKAALAALEQARAARGAARQGHEILSRQLEAKLAACGGREALGRELHDALMGKAALEKEQALLGAQLPPPEQRASLELARLESGRAATAAREEAARRDFDQASALLAHAQGEGYYSKLAAAEEERALARELLRGREAHAHGVRLLRGLVHARRERMNSNLLDPIETAVTRHFEQLRGGDAGRGSRVVFGSDLHDLGVRAPGDADGRVEKGLETLSLGTQEQVLFSLRLAFGELLSERGEKPEPQLVILDDPLVNADPVRQERAREMLKKASAKLQILILTARPEDYRSLSPKEYDLATLKS